jgi:hypothetical protein
MNLGLLGAGRVAVFTFSLRKDRKFFEILSALPQKRGHPKMSVFVPGRIFFYSRPNRCAGAMG